jgi:hypothetical protein
MGSPREPLDSVLELVHLVVMQESWVHLECRVVLWDRWAGQCLECLEALGLHPECPVVRWVRWEGQCLVALGLRLECPAVTLP